MGSGGGKMRFLERMDAYWVARPRRATTIVLVMAVAIMLVLIAILIQAFGVRSVLPFLPPYKSTDTLLSLTENGVKFSGENMTIGTSGVLYSNLRFFYGNANGGTGGTVANDPDLSNLSSGTAVVVVTHPSGLVYDDGSMGWNYLTIAEKEGNGVFEGGDYLLFDFSASFPIAEDTVYIVALACHQDGFGVGWEFSFAVHNGKFYSWYSDELNTDEPWWE